MYKNSTHQEFLRSQKPKYNSISTSARYYLLLDSNQTLAKNLDEIICIIAIRLRAQMLLTQTCLRSQSSYH